MTPPEAIAAGIGLMAVGLLLWNRAPRIVAATVEPCDDCPGGPNCRCNNGMTDPTTCTCAESHWLDERIRTETDSARRAAYRMIRDDRDLEDL